MSNWFKSTLSALMIILFLGCTTPGASTGETTASSPRLPSSDLVEVTNHFGTALDVLDVSNLTITEQRARTAAVKITSLLKQGHGSGTYMIMYGRRVVVTAAHVVGDDTTMLVIGRGMEEVLARVVFRDDERDLAVLVVPEIKSRTAIKYRPQLKYDERLIGTKLTYTGFPSHHDLLTIRGYVASLERSYIVTNMFGWFGSSGSGVFDQHGRLVGVVSGIDVGRYLIPIPLEDVVWVAPISTIDHATLKIRILVADPVGSLRAFPGATAPRRGSSKD